eukprot:451663-Amphidinium_carterae.1
MMDTVYEVTSTHCICAVTQVHLQPTNFSCERQLKVKNDGEVLRLANFMFEVVGCSSTRCST